MSKRLLAALAATSLAAFAATSLAAASATADPYEPRMASCKLTYNLSGWSFIYRQMKGQGQVACSNGQRADVRIQTHGGGLTAGKSDIIGGRGTFSEVKDISEVFGTYAQIEAHAGAAKSSGAGAMTKGEVSLALAGTGRGVDLGVSIGAFTIEPASTTRKSR